MQLFCVFVFENTKSRFSHEAAHLGVAEAVFNKCISNGATQGQVKFNYTYLDDQNERLNWMDKSDKNKSKL